MDIRAAGGPVERRATSRFPVREDRGVVCPLGLYDLDRKIRPVGRAYKELVEQWRHILPTESLCLHHLEPEEFETPDEELLTLGGED